MVGLSKLSALFFSVALVSLTIGCWLIHPAIAFIVAGLVIAGFGVLGLDYEG